MANGDLGYLGRWPKVRELRVTPVLVPLDQPIKTAQLVVTHAPLVLIDLRTEIDGQSGPTGRAYLFTYTLAALKGTVVLLQQLAPLIVDQVLAPVTTQQSLQSRFKLLGHSGLLGMSIAGIDMAIWDACARTAGIPLVALLGATPKLIPAYFSQGMDGAERGAELANEARTRGFRAMKIKIGYPTLTQDIAVIDAVRLTLGSGMHLMVDYNQSLTFSEALMRCHALDELGLAWIEEPLVQDDYAGYARLSREVKTPIQMGESWFGLQEMAKCVVLEASDLVMPDLAKIGGVTGWQQATSVAASRNLPVSSHLYQEFSAHLMCATATSHWLEYLGLADPVLEAPVVVVDGFVSPSDGPGAGLQWNAEAVERFRVK